MYVSFATAKHCANTLSSSRLIVMAQEGNHQDRINLPERKIWQNSIVRLAILVVALSAGLFVWRYKISSASHIPKNIVKSVNFSVFYPSPLPDNYSLNKDSIKIQTRILFFTLQNGDNKISVSEQSAPSNPPNLQLLTQAGFSKINTTLGQAVQGTNGSRAVAVLLTNTTLINVIGSSSTPSDAVTSVITRLHSLSKN
jgi:hypothetical protein